MPLSSVVHSINMLKEFTHCFNLLLLRSILLCVSNSPSQFSHYLSRKFFLNVSIIYLYSRFFFKFHLCFYVFPCFVGKTILQLFRANQYGDFNALYLILILHLFLKTFPILLNNLIKFWNASFDIAIRLPISVSHFLSP